MEEDLILSNPRWDYLQNRLLSDPGIYDLFFNSVDPVIQNKFLLSIRARSISMMTDSFNQFRSVFSQQQLELIRYSLIDCNFDPDLFFPAEEIQP